MQVFVPGKIDSQFEECLDAIDCKQYNEMRTPIPDTRSNQSKLTCLLGSLVCTRSNSETSFPKL